jgi:hypothetical protein
MCEEIIYADSIRGAPVTTRALGDKSREDKDRRGKQGMG